MAAVSRDGNLDPTTNPDRASARPAEAPVQSQAEATTATRRSRAVSPQESQWEAALARARWVARLGVRKQRPDGAREDWLEPGQRAELERRGRLRLALYKAADAFAAREGRAPDKREQRQLLARLIAEEEDSRETWSRAAAAFAEGRPEFAREFLRRFVADGPRRPGGTSEASSLRAASDLRETELAVGLLEDGRTSDPAVENGGSLGAPRQDPDDRPDRRPETNGPPEDQAVPDDLQVPQDSEALLRELVGDELYDQIWFGSIETMAREMDIDLELVERAGPEGAAALAAVALFRHLEIQLHKNKVNHLAVALGRRGHKQLESKLLARLAFQNSLGPDHERYSATNQELLEASAIDAKALPFLRALDSLVGKAPGVSLVAKAIPQLLIGGLENSIADRNRIIRARSGETDGAEQLR
ncbi:hypothetical protein [Algihabitans albus]|uniref:hypothetical protein n=1 Tax=Algihabitans albus TaxID=2164067 RepID=UPI000E5CF1C6|nr:hypothetical protein [Algihabitans albus]